MAKDALVTELRSLRTELDVMNQRMLHLRYADFRRVFTQEARAIVGDEARRSCSGDIALAGRESACAMREDCMRKLNEFVDQVARDLSAGEISAARERLAKIKAAVASGDPPCPDSACQEVAFRALEKIGLVLEIYVRLMDGSGEGGAVVEEGGAVGSPEEEELALAPLANAHRLRILEMLIDEDLGMSGISRRLGIRTGHLQFHVKGLVAAGYVAKDPRTKAYSITPRGRTALAAVHRLSAELRAPEGIVAATRP